jgi:hypothetical protein
MRVVCAVILTDKLAEVRAFYEKHFGNYLIETLNGNGFDVVIFGEARITYLDAGVANTNLTSNATIRIDNPYPKLERQRLIESGLDCTELVVEAWGGGYGDTVQSFRVTDPAGNHLQFFVDHANDDKALTLTRGGIPARDLHNPKQS